MVAGAGDGVYSGLGGVVEDGLEEGRGVCGSVSTVGGRGGGHGRRRGRDTGGSMLGVGRRGEGDGHG